MTQQEWDLYFIKIAKEVAQNSKCLSRKIGAVLVRDKSIISTGYNGPARGNTHCNDRLAKFYSELDNIPDYMAENPVLNKLFKTQCPRKALDYKSGQGLHLCQAGHAERNALIQAGRFGIATEGASLYCYCGQVCKDCAIEIVNAGIKELIYLGGSPVYDKYADTILREGGVEVRIVEVK